MSDQETNWVNKYGGIMAMVASFVTVLVIITSIISNSFTKEIEELKTEIKVLKSEFKDELVDTRHQRELMRSEFDSKLNKEAEETDSDIRDIHKILEKYDAMIIESTGENSKRSAQIEELFRLNGKNVDNK